jgi:peptide/nickel transport system permease protein
MTTLEIDAPERTPQTRPGLFAWIGRASPLRVLTRSFGGAFSLGVLVLFMLVAVFAPLLAPYGPFDIVYDSSHHVVRLSPPTLANWFGTTNWGMDVLSQVIWGTRVALLVGLISAIASALLGTAVGIVAGYFGGVIDEALMRATDVAFAIPFLPFAMVVISMARPSLGLVIALIVAFMWRMTARVIRAQVLSLRTRTFVRAARASGAGPFRILWRHILPNVLPLSFLYVAVGVQSGVMLEAALSFLGFGDPNQQSWGYILNAAFKAGAMRTAWWWVLPPSIALALLVTSVFMITRAYEEQLNPRLRME